MSDPTTSKPRGEAAWIAHRDAIQARNAEAKKTGKARHDEWERLRETNRRNVDAREERRFIQSREES
jgi:hypothetical protein